MHSFIKKIGKFSFKTWQLSRQQRPLKRGFRCQSTVATLRRKNETRADIDLLRWRVTEILFLRTNYWNKRSTSNVGSAGALNNNEQRFVHVILYNVTSFMCLVVSYNRYPISVWSDSNIEISTRLGDLPVSIACVLLSFVHICLH